MKKRLLASLLALCLLVGLFPTAAMAAESGTSDSYNDVSLADAMAYLQGEGTQTDPFQIWSANDLYYINYIEYWNGQEETPATYYYEQRGNLDLASASKFDQDTGYITADFSGVYDGGGNTISGMTKPLFYVVTGGTVRNVTLSEPQIEQSVASDVIERIGAVASYATGAEFSGITVSGGSIEGVTGAASILGTGGSVTITNCTSSAAVNSSVRGSAGIVSYLYTEDDANEVTGCTYSGTISGNTDGSDGIGGIVGAASGDETMTLTGCTFSGSINVNVASGTGKVGGILGAANTSAGITMSGNSASGTLPELSNNLYVGQLIGNVADGEFAVSGPVSITGEELGDYGNIQSATLSGEIGALTLPATSGDITLYIDATATISSITASTSGTLNIYNEAEISGAVTNSGTINIYANTGSMGDVNSSNGSVNVGAANKTAATAGGQVGNEGTIGDITASGKVFIYRNDGTIGNLTSSTAEVVIGQGQGDNTYLVYNTNTGTIGSVKAHTYVNIYGLDSAENPGTVATGEGQSVETETGGIEIGKSGWYNQNDIGELNSATVVRIYGDEGSTVGNVEAGTNITVGAYNSFNAADVGNLTTTGGNVTIYGAAGSAIGDVTANSGTVQIGSSANKNASTIGNVTAASVAGYTTGKIGTITGSSTLINAYVEEGQDVINVTGNVTITADSDGNITVNDTEYNGGSKLVLTGSGTVTISGENTVKLSSIDATGTLTVLDASGKSEIGSITVSNGELRLGNNTAVFGGKVTGSITASNGVFLGDSNDSYYFTGTVEGNISGSSVTIRNKGTVGSSEGDTQIVANSDFITMSNAAEGKIYSNIVNNSASKNSNITNNGTLSGDITQKGTGTLILNGSKWTGENYTGTISVAQALTIGDDIGTNNEDSAINVTFTGESGTISTGDYSFYLKVTGNENLKSLTIASTATGNNKNTVNASSLASTVSIMSSGTGTTVKMPDGEGGESQPSQLGTLVTSPVSSTVSGDSYATGDITVGSSDSTSVSVSADEGKTLTVTAASATITNYGTIGNINHTGTGTLTIYNIGDGAKIGNVTSAGTVVVGASNQTTSESDTKVGNEGTMGNIAATGRVTVYRNTGTIGDVTSQTDAVVIGQNGSEYNTNSGSIGGVSAAANITVYGNSTNGSIARDDGKVIKADGEITIGSTSTPNLNQIGDVDAGGKITIYGGEGGSIGAVNAASAQIGSASAYNRNEITSIKVTGDIEVRNAADSIGSINGGNVRIFANSGVIDSVTSDGTISVGEAGAKQDSKNIGNTGTIESIEATGNVSIYRNNGENATIESIKSTSGSVTIGLNNNTFNANTGSIGSVDAKTSVTINSYSGQVDGSVAAGDGQTIKAGTSVTIGSANVANAIDFGTVGASTDVVLYSGSGTAGSIKADGTVTAHITDNSSAVNITTTDGNVSIIDETTGTGSAPSVNITTTGGDVSVSRDDDDENAEINAQVNLTVTNDGSESGQNITVTGEFSSVNHQGKGDIIMGSADTAIDTVVTMPNSGEIKEFGTVDSTVEVPEDNTTGYVLSLVPGDRVNELDVVLLTADGTALPDGTLSLTVTGGTLDDEDNSITVKGGGASETVGTITVSTEESKEDIKVTVSGSFTPSGEEPGGAELKEASSTVTFPAAIDRVDTVFLTSEEDFNAAKTEYGWGDDVAEPSTYPVLAVMPVVNQAYSDSEITVKVGENTVNNNVAFVSVDKDVALSSGSVSVTVAASGTNVPDYSATVSYTLSAVDRAKLQPEIKYYYVTLKYMDGATADEVIPVVQGQSTTLPSDMTREGYSFLGWQAEGGDTLYKAGMSYTPTEDVTLTAQWGSETTTHTLTISISGSGSVVRVENGQEYPIASGTNFNAGETVTLRAVRNAGYRFSYWIVNGTYDYNEEVTLTMSSDQTVTAVFSRISSGGSSSSGSGNRVSVGSVDNGRVTVSPSRAPAGTQVTITVRPDRGYELSSLQVETTSGDDVDVTRRGDGRYTFTMPREAVRVIAVFTEIAEGPAVSFADVSPDAYYYDAVLWAVEQGITNGTSATTFAPNNSCTRAQMVTFLWRAAGSPAATGANPFADLSADAYYYDAVLWAVQQGITNGTSATTFSPDATVTRGQTVTFLWRYAGSPAVSGSGFADVAADAYYAGAVAWASQQGVTSGTSATTFSPSNNCTRAQIVTFLYRYMV